MPERSASRPLRLGGPVLGGEVGLRLVDLLTRRARQALGRNASRSRVRALIAAGVVRVDGRVERLPGQRLLAGQRIDAWLRPGSVDPRWRTGDRPFRLGREAVLFRDDVLIAVDKPPGLPVHATADRERPHLVAHVQELLAREGRAPYVGVHQRLDRDTSGVVLFAISPLANAALARAFQGGSVEKTYLALTKRGSSVPEAAFRVSTPLTSVHGGRHSGRVRAGGPDAQAASTDFDVREVLPSALLVEARPRTGRKHQVRAHLAHAGHPVLGDPLYGEPGGPAGTPVVPRTMLHAWRLAFPHPVSGRRIQIESPLPADFAAALASARRRPPRRRRR